MFWRRRNRGSRDLGTPEDQSGNPPGPLAETPEAPPEETAAGPIQIERDASRPAAIHQAVEELVRRGEDVVELFKEIESPEGRVILPIYLRRGPSLDEDAFAEVAAGPWGEQEVARLLKTIAVLRSSDYSDATFEVLSAYPIPDKARFFFERSAAALLQLDLVHQDDFDSPADRAEAFKNAAGRHWGQDLHYEPDELPVVEELLLAALAEQTDDGRPPILDALVYGLGCYVGETLRRHAPVRGSWKETEDWGAADAVLDFPDVTADPIGQARAFLENGPEDSVAFYVSYVLEELSDSPPG